MKLALISAGQTVFAFVSVRAVAETLGIHRLHMLPHALFVPFAWAKREVRTFCRRKEHRRRVRAGRRARAANRCMPPLPSKDRRRVLNRN